MNTIDLQEKYNNYYTASEQPESVYIHEATYVSILGDGSPGTTAFYEKKKAILHFVEMLQSQYAGTEKAFTSGIVEIFYWFEEEQNDLINIGNFYTTIDLDLLRYRVAIRIPEYITRDTIEALAQGVAAHSSAKDFERFVYTAGECVQVLHVGPLAGELETLPLLQQFATANGLIKSGMHHEIHLVNFERGQNQSHLRTILRDPVLKHA